MHPADKQWWITHSGDYVLGLLSNADRLVFERIMQVDLEVEQLVVDWREKLHPMSDALTPVEPPDHIWDSLSNNLPEQPVHLNGASISGQDGTDQDALHADPVTIREADRQASLLADGTAFQRLLDQKQQALNSVEKSADGWRLFAGLMSVASIFMGGFIWVLTR